MIFLYRFSFHQPKNLTNFSKHYESRVEWDGAEKREVFGAKKYYYY